MSSFPSRAKYYAFVVGLLIALDLFILYYLVPINPDLNLNLFSEIWGIIATVLLLMVVIEYREYRAWKKVEEWVERRMGKLLYNLVNILARFIYPKSFSPLSFRDEIVKILEDLNKKERVTLTPFAYNYYFPKPKDKMSIHQLEILFRYRQYLNDLEIKYSRFFKPEIQISLMEIQNHLDAIEADFNLVSLFPVSEKVVKDQLPQSILRLMKEIYKVHKAGIVISPK